MTEYEKHLTELGQHIDTIMSEANHIPHKNSMQEIAESVCKSYGITLSELIGERKKHNIVTARMLAVYHVYWNLFPAVNKEHIAKFFGYRDHTSVCHALSKVSQLMLWKSPSVKSVNIGDYSAIRSQAKPKKFVLAEIRRKEKRAARIERAKADHERYMQINFGK